MSDNEPVHLTTLREALEAYVKRAGISRRLKQQNVLADWPEIVGPRIAAATTALRVAEDGTLVIAVRTAAWMQELKLLSPEIVRLLARRGAGIKQIRWVAG